MHMYLTFPITFQFTQNLVHSILFPPCILCSFDSYLIVIYSELFGNNNSKMVNNRIIINECVAKNRSKSPTIDQNSSFI